MDYASYRRTAHPKRTHSAWTVGLCKGAAASTKEDDIQGMIQVLPGVGTTAQAVEFMLHRKGAKSAAIAFPCMHGMGWPSVR